MWPYDDGNSIDSKGSDPKNGSVMFPVTSQHRAVNGGHQQRMAGARSSSDTDLFDKTWTPLHPSVYSHPQPCGPLMCARLGVRRIRWGKTSAKTKLESVVPTTLWVHDHPSASSVRAKRQTKETTDNVTIGIKKGCQQNEALHKRTHAAYNKGELPQETPAKARVQLESLLPWQYLHVPKSSYLNPPKCMC